MQTPEGRVKKAVKKYLDEIGAYHYWPVKRAIGAKTVDCLACYRGYFVAIEVKRPGETATKLQEDILDKVRGAVGWAIVEDSEFLSALRSVIETIDMG